jgi:hypothetical protein
MNISAQDARGLFTRMVVDVYIEKILPKSFLRSFFPTVESATKLISIEVQRGFEKIAVDVYRGSEGNRNTFGSSTEKTFLPPFYREYFDATDMDLYERMAGTGTIDIGIFNQFLTSVAERLIQLTAKIDRAYELQCAQVLETGIVTLNSGTNIDFKRKAASKVDAGSGNYWTNGSVDPNTILESGANFIRQVGKAQGSVINILAGSEALTTLLNNDIVKDRAKFVQYGLDMVTPAQRDSVGASFHGEISFGSYRGRLWSYPEFYDNAAGESTPYLNPKNVVLLPEKPQFKLSYAAVPQLLDESAAPKQGAYLIGEFKDVKNTAHIFDVKSAGVAVPVAVDQIYTAQVVGD